MSEQQKKLKSTVTKYIWHLKVITCMGILTGAISPVPILSYLSSGKFTERMCQTVH